MIFLEELYKSIEISDELCYIVETFIKKAKKLFDGGLLEMEGRRQHFFRGGLSGHLKAIKRPSQGVRGRRPPGWYRSFIFYNDSKYSKMNPFFKNSNIFLAKNPVFLRKLSKNWSDFTRISEFFRKIILKFSIFMILYKAKEIHGGFYYQVEKILKILKI